MTLVIAIILVCLLGGFGFVIANYNKLVKLRNMVQNGWAQVDVLLKRRIDLIPNLVEVVKGYANFESSALEKVVRARNTAMGANTIEDSMDANNQLTGTLRSLFAVSEAYPDLKANHNFMDLQKQLAETEDKISLARQFYNDIVTKYNIVIEVFPSNIIARIFNFRTEQLFQIDESEREVPKVSF